LSCDFSVALTEIAGALFDAGAEFFILEQ